MSTTVQETVSAEDFAQIRAQVREFVRQEVVPREREIADADAIPDDLRHKAAAMGLFGYALPQEYGGLGLVITQDVELAFEFGYTALAFRSLFGTNNGIAGQVIAGFGTDAQKKRWLEPMAEGACLASFALTEPEAGSDPSGMRTTATWSADGWSISGQKRFITNAPLADLFVTFARVRGTEADGKIAVFLVPAGSAGLTVGPKDRKMGQEGATTADVYFDAVRVGHDALISGEVETGFRAAMTVLARGRVHISALATGLAERALDESVRYSAQNRQGGVPTGDRQLVQAMLAEQQALVLAGKALARDTARKYLDGSDRRIAPSAAKLFCTEAAGRAADLAVQVHGGSGYMREVAVERIYRDARLLRLYEGTSEIQKLIIGRELMRRERAGGA
ncbi:acyl-CoA dehydrogenase family protein [Streptomyces sp. SID8499]|uniref:acyl-CoA dehydrogenase family protein n=1 Tax=unclassified Streptomyces TaxID=2593676 RepID=UPI0013BCB06B|nr:acyl-CoA dehydrogenase family protein [Streptomyces sp. SID8499]MYX44382.1 acyl-CoA dehydrogenase [Streptomyces sp. SID89]NED31726.1 acyl-CoA/acyl-ACP dehydrogenase [Streptomyces sp. SID8499]